MDESMNSVHSISAMDISPACSPTQPVPSNSSVLTAFQHQQQVLSSTLFSTTKPASEVDERPIFSTLNKTFEETNQLRQRIVTDPLASLPETETQTMPKKTSANKMFLVVLVVPLLIYFLGYFRATPVLLSQKSAIQNATEYLRGHLIGQDKALQAFESALEKHKNFSMILIQVKEGRTRFAGTLRFIR